MIIVTGAESVGAERVQVLYECAGWNPGTPFSRPLGIFFDPQREECYVADTGNGQVVVFNKDGMPVYRFYHDVPGRSDEPVPGQPRSLVVDDTGRIYLVDSQVPYIDVLNPRGLSTGHIDVPPDQCGQPERFVYVAIGRDQTVYAVTACVLPRVAVIRDGATVSSVITLHNPEAERSCVTGLAVDPEGRLVITDACAPRVVQIYGPDGQLVRAFGKHETGYENFGFSAGVAVTDIGDLWIADSIRQVASRFDHEGNLLAMIGGKGSQPGAFEYPSAVATDGGRRVFVLEREGRRYQCFQILEEGSGATEH